jgi:hypothetical protein
MALGFVLKARPEPAERRNWRIARSSFSVAVIG